MQFAFIISGLHNQFLWMHTDVMKSVKCLSVSFHGWCLSSAKDASGKLPST